MENAELRIHPQNLAIYNWISQVPLSLQRTSHRVVTRESLP